MSSIGRIREIQWERLNELAAFGVKAEPGPCVAGSFFLTAAQGEKVLKLLRRLKKLEEKAKALAKALAKTKQS